MRAKSVAVFLGLLENDFTNKDTGELVHYRKATFQNPDDPTDIYTVGVPAGVDVSCLIQYAPCYLLLDFRFSQQYGNFRGRLVNVFPDADTMAYAPALTQAEAANL